jgi:hypothetical protein
MILLNSWPIVLRTKSGLPKYCNWEVDRHGKRRVRFRKRGFSTYLYGTPWAEDFMRAYAAALDSVGKPAIATLRTKGTFNALADAYYSSSDFRSLGASTRAQRRRAIARLCLAHGDMPVKGLRREHIERIIIGDMAVKTPEAANNLVKLLRVMLAYAVTLGMISSNPAKDIKRYKRAMAPASILGPSRKFPSLRPRMQSAPRPDWRRRCCSSPGSACQMYVGWAGKISAAT